VRVLVISGLFPPNTIGGAEFSAWNLARALVAKGCEVAVLTTAYSPDAAVRDVLEDGMRIWRVWPPRNYPVTHVIEQSAISKAWWHTQDHFEPRNLRSLRELLEVFQPDIASVHLLTGLGFNLLGELGDRDIPVMFALHDLSLTCLRSSRFKHGHVCRAQCTGCRLSGAWKRHMVKKVRRIGFYSPSAANLAAVDRDMPLGGYPCLVAPDPNSYPAATVVPVRGRVPRFLYVGRIHETKGVHILLAAAERLAGERDFTLTIVGDGPSAGALRRQYANRAWLSFTGQVSQQEVSNHMALSDVLCVPSIWLEPLGGVIVGGLGQGMAILASRTGGIPELIEDGVNGLLVEPGSIDAWATEMAMLMDRPERLASLRLEAASSAARFKPEVIVEKLFDFLCELAGQPPACVALSSVADTGVKSELNP
jgi:glycosyltransferase involved in cell wall biosynthesis